MSNRIRRRLMHSLMAISLAVLLFFGITACTTIPSPDQAEQVTQHQVIETVFKNIEKRYAAAATIGNISIAGLKSLSKTDALLSIGESRELIKLHYDNHLIGSWRKPQPNDYDLWAALTSSALTAGWAQSGKLRTEDRGGLLDRFFKAGLAKLDHYTRYEGPDKARNTRARREGFGGLGVTIRHDEDKTFVRRVHEGTPAFNAGVLVGDQITHIDGKSLTALSQRSVIGKLRGPIHSRADLTIIRNSSPSPLTVTLIRAHIILPTVTSTLEDGVLNIIISGFNQGTSRSIGKILSETELSSGNVKGIILDLRGNPGGLLDQAVAIADYFLNNGRIISTRGRHRRANQTFDASWGERAPKLPIVILVNGLSASAAEIVAVAMRDRSRAVIVGTSSYGKGSVQTIVRLPNGGELTLTWAYMIAPSGFNLQNHGVIPAICTSGSEDRLRAMMSSVKRDMGSGDPTLAAMLASRYAVRSDPTEARKMCPPSKRERPEDTEIARYILKHGEIYHKALHDGAPAIAER
ncbi:MAG: S41 family peptidase [Pseudomonadota bacterium]|nr:S41 family peptidase [Pseudomonadota bacterium]